MIPSKDEPPGLAKLIFAVDATRAGSFQNTPAPTKPSTYDLIATSDAFVGFAACNVAEPKFHVPVKSTFAAVTTVLPSNDAELMTPVASFAEVIALDAICAEYRHCAGDRRG